MNNLKKIGLSALAGSLVAFSANAVEMSVSGTAEITYTAIQGDHVTTSTTTNVGVNPTTANPFGSNTSLKFSGSGNVGFADVTIVRTLNDGIASALSAYQTMDMGDLGTISFDAIGGGLEGVTAYDDKLPTAYEEIWNGVSSSGISGAASNDTLGYSNTFGPLGISLAYTKGGSSGSSDGSGAPETSTGATSDAHITLDASSMIDGLTIMAGTTSTDVSKAGQNDTQGHVGHIVYSAGAVSVGYRKADYAAGKAGKAGKIIDAASIAFAVNENLSVSVGTQDTEYDVASGVNVTEKVDAVSASYTAGAASVRLHAADSSSDGGVTGKSAEYMELSLVLAF